MFSFHPLLIGGNPFTASSIYCLIAFLERRWGVHFAMGGTGRLVEGLVRLIEGQGGSASLQPGGSRDHREGWRGARRASRLRRNDRRRYRGVERRFGLDLPASAAGLRAVALDRQAHRARALFHEPVRLVLRHAPQIRRRAAPHHPARAALPGIADRHLRAQGSGRRFQPVSASPDRDRSRRSRPTAAMRSTCCRRCRICRAAPTGA